MLAFKLAALGTGAKGTRWSYIRGTQVIGGSVGWHRAPGVLFALRAKSVVASCEHLWHERMIELALPATITVLCCVQRWHPCEHCLRPSARRPSNASARSSRRVPSLAGQRASAHAGRRRPSSSKGAPSHVEQRQRSMLSHAWRRQADAAARAWWMTWCGRSGLLPRRAMHCCTALLTSRPSRCWVGRVP